MPTNENNFLETEEKEFYIVLDTESLEENENESLENEDDESLEDDENESITDDENESITTNTAESAIEESTKKLTTYQQRQLNIYYYKRLDWLYSVKFEELRLRKRENEFNEASKELNFDCKTILSFNGLIFIKIRYYNCFYGNEYFIYELIKKEHFLDSLTEHQKEKNYWKIKKYISAINDAKHLLEDWSNYRVKNSLFKTKTHSKLTEPYDREEVANWVRLLEAQCRSYHLIPIPPLELFLYNPNLKKPEIDYLYNLCDGDIEFMKQFAKLLFDIKYETDKHLSTVILAKKEIHESLINIFEILFYEKDIPTGQLKFCSFRDLFYKNGIPFILEQNFRKEIKIILISGNTIFRKGQPYSYFKKLLNGKNNTIKSPYFHDELTFKNTIPTVFITDDEKKYRTMKSLYNSTGIVFNSKTPFDMGEPSVFFKPLVTMEPSAFIKPSVYYESTDFAKWLRNEFLYIGKKTVKTPDIQEPNEIDHEILIKKFLGKCCSFRANYSCSIQSLYQAYLTYLQHCFSDDEENISQIKFSKIVRELKSDQIEKYRSNKVKAGNRLYCFKGIKLKDKYEEIIENEPVKETHKTTNTEQFEIKLKGLINETFKDMEPITRKATRANITLD